MKICTHKACELSDLGVCLEEEREGTSPSEMLLIRERAGVTQEDAAAMVHVYDARTWRRWEHGERQINETCVHLFCLLTDQPYPVAGD